MSSPSTDFQKFQAWQSRQNQQTPARRDPGGKTIVGDVISDVGHNITGVSILWGVIPAAVITVLLFILLFSLADLSKPLSYQSCKGTGLNKVCTDEEASGWTKLLPIFVASAGLGMIVGKGCYALALMEKNRKASAGLAGAYVAKSIWNM
jgi:hypothetical protein